MKKTTENKINKYIGNNKLCFDSDNLIIYWNNVKLNQKKADLVDEIKTMYSKGITWNDITEYAKKNKFSPNDTIAEKLEAIKNTEWAKGMDVDKKGNFERSKYNMMLFFQQCNEFGDNLRYNEFSGLCTYKYKNIEKYNITDISVVTEKAINNNDDRWVEAITESVCRQHSYHPIKTALASLPKWDGVKRAETFFIDYIGADDTELNRHMTMKFFYAMMKRLFEPGCPFDHMLIVCDEKHGTGKSTLPYRLLSCLDIDDEENKGWIYLDSLDADRDTVQTLNKAWIACLDEMAKTMKEDAATMKKFITQRFDDVRLSYGRFNNKYARHCVLYGSTNEMQFIKDYTDDYERRFWIMDCVGTERQSSREWDELLPNDYCKQVMAEIYDLYNSDSEYEYNTLSNEDVRALKEVQKQHMTLNADDVLAYQINTILDLEFENTDFETYESWQNAVNKAISERSVMINAEKSVKNMLKNDGFFDENVEKTAKKLQKIPSIWLKMYVQKQLGRAITSDNYLTRMIDCTVWMKNKNAYYNDIRGCYVRI